MISRQCVACLLVISCCNWCILNCNIWRRFACYRRHWLRQGWTLVLIWFNCGDLVTLSNFKKVLFFHIGLNYFFIFLIGSLWWMRFCAFCVVLWRAFLLSARHVQWRWSNITYLAVLFNFKMISVWHLSWSLWNRLLVWRCRKIYRRLRSVFLISYFGSLGSLFPVLLFHKIWIRVELELLVSHTNVWIYFFLIH